MKPTIENAPKLFADTAKKFDQLCEFHSILEYIEESKTREELKEILKLKTFEYFLFGFGGSHLWVRQIIREEIGQQVIFVDFN